MDFEKELQTLLDAEETLPQDPLAELARAQAGLLERIRKQGADMSLQTEEIYDIVKENDENAREIKLAAKRENLLLNGLVSLCDLLDGLLRHMQNTPHACTAAAQKEQLLHTCGLEPLGAKGERLDPRLHTVSAAEYGESPTETVIRVLESGYVYRGKVLRKATVILSKGNL